MNGREVQNYDFLVKLDYAHDELDTQAPSFEGLTYSSNYQKGKTYGVGDVITVKVHASDNVGVKNVWLYFGARTIGGAGGKSTSIDRVQAVYNSTTNTWDYDLKMKDNMYPGEWTISYLYIYDTSNNMTGVYSSDYVNGREVQNYDFYVFFSNNGVLYIPTYTVTFRYYDAAARKYQTVKTEQVEVHSDATPPTEIPQVPGYVFEGWEGTYKNITCNTNINAKLKKVSSNTPSNSDSGNKNEDASNNDSSNSSSSGSSTTIVVPTTPTGITVINNLPVVANVPINEPTSVTQHTNDVIAPLTNEGDGTTPDQTVAIESPQTLGSTTDAADSVKEIPAEQKTKVVSAVEKMSDGESVTIKMDKATVVPKEVLESIQGKDVEVTLDMGDYSWVINGKDVYSSMLKDIDLEVSFDNDAIPSKAVSQVAGDNPVKKVSLTYNGGFGFNAKLKVNMGSEFAGKYGNLYYYDSSGYMRFQNAGLINADGSVELVFSHASEYLIVVSDKAMESPKMNGIATTQTAGFDMTSLYFVIGIIVIAGVAVGAMYYRKRKMI